VRLDWGRSVSIPKPTASLEPQTQSAGLGPGLSRLDGTLGLCTERRLGSTTYSLAFGDFLGFWPLVSGAGASGVKGYTQN
jgi:hypothetical protein